MHGRIAVALLIGIAIVLALLARGIYRLNPAAWWSTVLLIVLGLVDSLTTFSRVDPFDVYRLSGSPPQQIEMMQQIGMPSRATMILPTVLYGVGLLGYLVWIRRYFRHDTAVVV